MFTIPANARPGVTLEFYVQGAQGKFQVGGVPSCPPSRNSYAFAFDQRIRILTVSCDKQFSVPHGVQPGSSQVQAQIPDDVVLPRDPVVTFVAEDRRAHQKLSLSSNPSSPVSGKAEENEDDEPSPTRGIPLDIESSRPSAAERPLPAVTSALLAATAAGKPISKLRGKLLLVTPTTLRSGPGNLFGNVFDLNDNFIYVGTPCGHPTGASDGSDGSGTTTMSPSACGRLIQRLLMCQPTYEDILTMFRLAPRPRFPQNSGLGRLITQVIGPLVVGTDGQIVQRTSTNTTGDVVNAFAGLCQRKVMVVQERFFGGPVTTDTATGPKVLIPSLLIDDATLPVVLGIRDVREVVPARMNAQEQAQICGVSMTQKACAEMLCSAVVNVHTAIISRLYGLSAGSTDSKSPSPPKLPAVGNPIARYLIVKYEDILEEPRMLAARIIHWAGTASTGPPLATTTPRRFDDFLRRTVDESDTQLRTSVRGAEEVAEKVDELKVCRTALVTLAYQTAALNRDKAPHIDPSLVTSQQSSYPGDIKTRSWTAICQLQSRIVKDVRGYGGLTAHCQCPGRVSFEECRWRLRNAPQCSALSYSKDGRCCLHDRMGKDFTVGKDPGGRHTVKMLEGVDACITLPSPKFTALQGRIANMMRRHSLHVRSSLATVGRHFYMYDGPEFKWRDLITCYRHENSRMAPWEDERWPELAQNTGQVSVYTWPCSNTTALLFVLSFFRLSMFA